MLTFDDNIIVIIIFLSLIHQHLYLKITPRRQGLQNDNIIIFFHCFIKFQQMTVK
jgi:hypothetical protein